MTPTDFAVGVFLFWGNTMVQFLWVCIGGAAGSGFRFLLSGWVAHKLGSAFPFGTLCVNLLGSFLLGFIMQVGLTTEMISPMARLTLTTGVMGGFTTYSTFNYETLRILEDGIWEMAIANVAATVIVCLVAGKAGVETVNFLLGRV